MMQTIILWAEIIAFLFGIGYGIYYLINFIVRFPNQVVSWNYDQLIVKDRARIVKRPDGRKEFQLFKKQQKHSIIMPKKYDMFIQKKKEFLFFKKIGHFLFRPMKIMQPNPGQYNIENIEAIPYYFTKRQELKEKHIIETWWDKHGREATLFFIVSISFVLIILVIGKIDNIASAIGGATQRASVSWMQQLTGGLGGG